MRLRVFVLLHMAVRCAEEVGASWHLIQDCADSQLEKEGMFVAGLRTLYQGIV